MLTSSTTNPATTYLGTTWEELPQNKFLKTGATPLQQSGSNIIKLTKANLPADKLQVDSHSMTRGNMEITGTYKWSTGIEGYSASGAFSIPSNSWNRYGGHSDSAAGYTTTTNFNASKTWSGSTSSASPYTTAMGSGTPLTINPEHITIKAWKRIS